MQKTNKSLLMKILTVLCSLCFLLVLAFGLVGCGEEQVTIVDSKVNSEGKLVLIYSDGSQKEYDVIGKDGADGADGADGVDGITPTITVSEDGFWVINGTKTEHKAVAQDGAPGAPGADGAPGAPGADAVAPTVEISADGYWVINGVNTGVKAKGEDGKDLTACAHEHLVKTGLDFIRYDVVDKVREDVCGFELKICEDCNHTLAFVVAHVLEDTAKTDPTCTEVGYNAGKTCKVCTYASAGTIPATGHVNMKEIEFFDIKANKDVNPCVDVWYEGKVCLDCGHLDLTEKQPIGHDFENIRVGTFATPTQKCTLVGDCKICDNKNLTVTQLPSLSETNNYAQEVVGTTQASHVIKYVGTYNGVEYIVQPGYLYVHDYTVINDYTAEKYPNIVFESEQIAPNCKTAVNGGYVCDVCNRWIKSTVKTAHKLPATVTDDVIKADVYAKIGCTSTRLNAQGLEEEYLDDVILKYECAECHTADAVEVETKQFGHVWKIKSITENAENAKLIDLHFECEMDATHVKTVKGVKDYTKVDANCSKDGLITYTDNTGTATIVIPANGKHVCEGAKTNITAGSTISYDDYLTLKGSLYFAPGVDIACGETVDAGFICKVCEKYIAVKVAREHSKVYDETTRKNPTCVTNGEVKWTCAYADCPAHEAVQTEILYGQHAFEFVRMDGEDLIVKCTTEGCTIENAEQTIAKADYTKTSVTGRNCKDYLAGNKNYDKYEFTFTDGKDYVVYNYFENIEHQLNNKKQNAGGTVEIGTPGTYLNGDSAPANCKTTVDGTFICELCKKAIAIEISGTHAPLTTQEVKSDALDCEVAAYKYYICGHDGCTVRVNVEKISDALTHDYVAKVNLVNNTVTFTCKHEGCDLNKTVKLSACKKGVAVTDCVNVTTPYEYEYKNGEFKQVFKFNTVEAIGEHNFLKADDGITDRVCTYEKVVDGKVVEIVKGFYCLDCGTLVVKYVK